MSYFNNHSHSHIGSNQRFKDSINKIPESIDYCCDELGLLGISFTDHASTSSALQACKHYYNNEEHFKEKGFKVAFGEECYLCPETVTKENVGNNHYNHFVLTALTEHGHKGIREMSTRAWTKNSFMHVMMRVPLYYSDLAEILPNYKGEIIGSSACLAGAIGYRLLQYKDIELSDSKRYENECWSPLINFVNTMNDLFGKGYFFLELQPSNHEEQRYVNKKIIQLSKDTNTDYIWTTDAHYMKKEDHNIHSMFLASQDKSENRDEFYDSAYFMGADEIYNYSKDYLTNDEIQLGLDNTKKIYDMVQMYDLRKSLHIPYVPLNKEEPNGKLYLKYKDRIKYLSCLYESKIASDRHLVREIINKIEERPEEFDNELTYKAIDECLKSLIDSSEKMGVSWSAYLLSVHDIVSLLWQKSVVMPGRGSGVGFILNYILGITDINPLRETTKTYPWRFLNPERASVLDIDIDIEGSKREECLDLLKSVYGEEHISKVLTYSTVKSRSAIQTAGRSLGIDNDITQYIGSLIPSDRGQLRTLSQVYYGNDEFEPITEFVNEINKYPKLFEYSLMFEGLVDGVGSHAGGIILSDTPLTDACSLQRTNSGDIITSYDLHECEDVSLIKYDNLSIEAADKIHACLDLLLENGVIEWKGSLRQTFHEAIGTYVLERNDPKMWEMLHRHEVYSLFQMEKQSGKAAIALSKPYSVDDLATLNSVIRLMAQEKGAESPLEKFARFKEDINEWYKEMSDYGLTEEEQNILKDILGTSYGICEAQEYLVILTTHPKIGGFSLGWGDRLRKAVAKKKPKDFIQLEKEFFDNMKEKNLSVNLCNYVWKVLISTQRGYGFNKSHTLAYSIIGLIELNLAYVYGTPLYWDAACLLVDSGAYNENDNDGTDYGKVGTVLCDMTYSGINIAVPDINKADFGFKVDTANNRIIYALKSINGINTDIAHSIIANRPYTSMQDFYEKMIDTKIITNSQMIMLIKGGCFTELHNKDRSITMKDYLTRYGFKSVEKLTMSQLNNILELGVLPEKYNLQIRYLNFKNYVLNDIFFVGNIIDNNKKIPKCGYHDRKFILDNNSQLFFSEYMTENSVLELKDEFYVVSEKLLCKEIDNKIQPLRDWFVSDEVISLYNSVVFEQVWNKNCNGKVPASNSLESWYQQSLSFYPENTELANIDLKTYGISDFEKLPEEPIIRDSYTRKIGEEYKEFPLYEITRIAGTVIRNDNMHYEVTLCTHTGQIVKVKFGSGQYNFYNRRLSKVDDKGVKKELEKSWFTRGTKLMIAGYRRGELFMPKVYNTTIFKHTCNRIMEINDDGTLLVQQERTQI